MAESCPRDRNRRFFSMRQVSCPGEMYQFDHVAGTIVDELIPVPDSGRKKPPERTAIVLRTNGNAAGKHPHPTIYGRRVNTPATFNETTCAGRVRQPFLRVSIPLPGISEQRHDWEPVRHLIHTGCSQSPGSATELLMNSSDLPLHIRHMTET